VGDGAVRSGSPERWATTPLTVPGHSLHLLFPASRRAAV
jgi:hypothetical protein